MGTCRDRLINNGLHDGLESIDTEIETRMR